MEQCPRISEDRRIRSNLIFAVDVVVFVADVNVNVDNVGNGGNVDNVGNGVDHCRVSRNDKIHWLIFASKK